VSFECTYIILLMFCEFRACNVCSQFIIVIIYTHMNHKYLKYKSKYLKLRDSNIDNQNGGRSSNDIIFCASEIIYRNDSVTKKNYRSTSNTMYQIASCSKFITSIVVAKLYELGKLDYDTDINNYLKQWKCNKNGITLRLLLTHTSGSTDNNGYLGAEPQYPLKQNLDLNMKIISGNSYSKPFNVTEKIGSKFMYSGAGFQVVQQVIEELTNKRLYQLMKHYIFAPLKMTRSTGKLLYEGKHNYPLAKMGGLYRMYPETAAAGVWMSCGDLLTLVVDLMASYNNDNGKILSRETVKLITKGEHPEWTSVYQNYGLGMFVGNDNDMQLFAHGGDNYGYKMKFHCVPEKNYIKIIMINHNPKYHKKLFSHAKNILNSLRKKK
jgi:CubicO group peptidase (beta-lactamase class C family)